jgi:hypothetical protein
MKSAAEMDSGAMIIHTEFHKDWFRHSKIEVGLHIQTHRQHGDLISLLLFFQNKESRLQKKY